MSLALIYEPATHWPPLGWMAVCEAGSSSVRLIHGPAVERRADWFCEAVWDAPFSEGNLDHTDLVFGSGGRCRDDGITFVSSGSTVDRLQVRVRGNYTFVSNSLACVLGTTTTRLDPRVRGYSELFERITQGIDQPVPDLPIVGGSIRLTYFSNLRWDGSNLHLAPKPSARRNFSRFDDYVGFMRSTLVRIADNMSSPDRARPYSWLGTISRGYDSPTCALLARAAGLRRVITHNESRPGERDDGTAVANALHLDCRVVDRLAWKNHAPLEPLFLAADAQGKEIMIADAASELRHTVLVTGHSGDTAWSINPEPFGEHMARLGHSGLSMTEYRLHTGFIHLPLPYMGLRQLPDLVKLSHSPEMKLWDTGGVYSRPICRRLLEEAGVPREMFGTSKRGASIRFIRGEDPWSRHGKRAFLRWLKTRGREYGAGLRLSLEARVCFFCLEVALWPSQRGPAFLRKPFQSVARALAERIKKKRLNDLAFIWAVTTVGQSYRVSSIGEDRVAR